MRKNEYVYIKMSLKLLVNRFIDSARCSVKPKQCGFQTDSALFTNTAINVQGNSLHVHCCKCGPNSSPGELLFFV